MTNWIVMVTKSYERPAQTRESRTSISPIESGLYDAAAIFTSEEEAIEYATMVELVGNRAHIYSPDQWDQRWNHLKERRYDDKDTLALYTGFRYP